MVPGTGCGLCGHFNFYIYLLFFLSYTLPLSAPPAPPHTALPPSRHRTTGASDIPLENDAPVFQKTPDRLHRADGDACLCRTPSNFRRCKRAVKLHENQKTGIAQMRSRFFLQKCAAPHHTNTLPLPRTISWTFGSGFPDVRPG